jgi:hypothetical protein
VKIFNFFSPPRRQFRQERQIKIIGLKNGSSFLLTQNLMVFLASWCLGGKEVLP